MCRECGRNEGGAGENPDMKVTAEVADRTFLPWPAAAELEEQDFYECKIKTVLLKRDLAKGMVKSRNICVTFDIETEHRLVSNTLVKEEELQFFPTDPVTVMLPIGKLLESRQIAVLALESAEKAGEVILIAAVVVEHGVWNSNRAPRLNLLRERFHPR
jgi:hypothetical protein